ncbi:MAG: hypothetical protein ACKO6N_12355 [Myxococcota bacterium]
MKCYLETAKQVMKSTVFGLCVLLAGQAQGADKQLEVTSVYADGSERTSCVILGPADNAMPRIFEGLCADAESSVILGPADNRPGRPRQVIITPADNRRPRPHQVIITPADNATAPGSEVIITPADNRIACQLPEIILGPADNVIITPADNRINCPFQGVIITPADNATAPGSEVIITPADNRQTSFVVLTNEDGLSSVVNGSTGIEKLDGRSTVKAETVLALVASGAVPSRIQLDRVSKAIANLPANEQTYALVWSAAEQAAFLAGENACGTGSNLASKLCLAIR